MSITDKLRECINEYGVFAQPSRLLAIADRIDAKLAERYMKLPADADGVPIHVGDKLQRRSNGFQHGEVMGIGNGVFFTRHYMNDYHKHFASDAVHYREPTVEDVLREFAESIKDQNADFGELVIAEYAAKLRLAGDE